MRPDYRKNSITLVGAITMGTGVMIGAGIFALTGQIAELAGPWFPFSFIAGAIVTGFSAYTYVKMGNAYPSAGGIAMILQKAYGPGTIAAAASLLMALSMVINESLVARTFGTYALQPFDLGDDSFLIPMLGVGLIVFAYLVNVSGNHRRPGHDEDVSFWLLLSSRSRWPWASISLSSATTREYREARRRAQHPPSLRRR